MTRVDTYYNLWSHIRILLKVFSKKKNFTLLKIFFSVEPRNRSFTIHSLGLRSESKNVRNDYTEKSIIFVWLYSNILQ